MHTIIGHKKLGLGRTDGRDDERDEELDFESPGVSQVLYAQNCLHFRVMYQTCVQRGGYKTHCSVRSSNDRSDLKNLKPLSRNRGYTVHLLHRAFIDTAPPAATCVELS